MTAARRLAAILAADVVGYSRLMGEDEAARAVREHREAAHAITLNANYGFPQPRPPSSMTALRCFQLFGGQRGTSAQGRLC
jgi:hypothetical protein